jgi:hypothetical protein
MFADADLANIIQSATETVAASFQARGSPEWMRVIEILSIEQAREWGTCTVSLDRFPRYMYPHQPSAQRISQVHRSQAFGIFQGVEP